MQCLSRTNGIWCYKVLCGLWNISNRKWLPSAFCSLFCNVSLTKMHKQANIETGEKPCIHVEERNLILLFLAMCAYRNSQSRVGKQSYSRMSMQMKVLALYGSHCCAVPRWHIVCSLPLVNFLRPNVTAMHKLDILENTTWSVKEVLCTR